VDSLRPVPSAASPAGVQGPLRLAVAIVVVGVLAVWLVKPIGDPCPDLDRLPQGSRAKSSPSFSPPLTRTCTYTAAIGIEARARYVPWMDWIVIVLIAGVAGAAAHFVSPATRSRAPRAPNLPREPRRQREPRAAPIAREPRAAPEPGEPRAAPVAPEPRERPSSDGHGGERDAAERERARRERAERARRDR